MEKISKAQVKFVRSLQLKKVRDAEGLFVAEGEKCVEELRRGFELVYYIQTGLRPDRIQTGLRPYRILLATSAEIEQMSSLKTPQGVIGVFRKNSGLMNGDAAKPLNGGLTQTGLRPDRVQTIIIMGNEGNGISAEVRKFITDPIYIPTYPNKETSDVVESLNVSIATAIVLAEFRRPR